MLRISLPSMASSSKIFGLALILALMCIKSCMSIECYECNSFTDKRCLGDENNKLDDELRKPCPQQTADGKPYKLCRKIKQMIDFEVNGLQPESRVIRSCGWDDSTYKNRCYQRSGFGGRQEVCACDGNNCNGSEKFGLDRKNVGLMLFIVPFMLFSTVF